MPRAARELPRHRTFVYVRAHAVDDGKGKVQPLQLTFEELVCGSLNLARRLALSRDAVETTVEYLDYLEFLATKRQDYLSKAVLEFDNDFRNFALHNGCALDDSAARASRADLHFDSGSIFCTSANRFIRGAIQQSSYRGRSQSFTAPQQNCAPVVAYFRWNGNLYTASAATCKFPHVCSNCGAAGHKKGNCPDGQNGARSNQVI